MSILTYREGRQFPSLAILALAFVAGGALLTASAQNEAGGTIQGTVTITNSDAPAEEQHRHALLNRYAANALEYGILSDPKSWRPYRLSETTVVYLEADPSDLLGPVSPPARHPILDQTGLRFHPQVLPIVKGTTVDFPNGDIVFHNVFSYSSPKEFDLGRYPMGDSRSVTFDKPGVVRVYCDIHSDMNATILVFNHPYFATPNEEGSFVIRNVPEGKYRLCLWHGRDVVLHRTVLVKSGVITTVNLSD